jgi:hypothetical protein
MVHQRAAAAIVHFWPLVALPDAAVSPSASFALWRPRFEPDFDGVP